MGKGGEGQKVYDYYGTIAGVVCEGPVDALVSVILDGKEVWPKAQAWKVGKVYHTNDLAKWNGRTWKYINAGSSVASTSNQPPNATYWSEYVLAASGDYSDVALGTLRNMRIYWGTNTQTVDPDLTSSGNRFGEQHPDYKGLCYVVLKKFRQGTERDASVNMEIVVRRSPKQSVITGAAAALLGSQANLLSAATELLTSDNGLGLPAALLDAATFQTAADYLHGRASVVASSPFLTEQATMREVADRFAEIGDFYLRWNHAAGLIQAGAFLHNAAPTTYHTLTIDQLAETPKFKAEGWASGKTRAVISFQDRSRLFKDTSDQVTDGRAFKVLGEHRALTLDRKFITSRAQALLHAAEELKVSGCPQASGTISVRREHGRSILPGDYVRLDIDMEPGGAQLLQFFRVVDKTTPPFGPIKFTLEAEDNLSPVPVNAYETPVVDNDDTVADAANVRIIPTPPAMAKFTDSVMILAERPADSILGFDAYFDTDDGGTFVRLDQVRSFAQRATLRSNHTSGATTIQVSVPAQVDTDLFSEQPGTIGANNDSLLAMLVELDGDDIKEDADGYSYVEVCSIESQSLVSAGNYDLTVLRGRQGTKSRAFTSANAQVWLIEREALLELTHGDMTTLRQNRALGTSPNTGYFKLQTFTSDNACLLADCPGFAFLFPSRIQAGSSLTLSSPTGLAVSVSGPYPASVTVTGVASGSVVAYRVSIQKSGGSEVVVEENSFTPRARESFSVPVQIDQAGTHYIRVYAFDITGLSTQTTIIVTAAAGTAKVATPEWYYSGKRLPNGSTMRFNTVLELRCATDGAAIHWRVGTSGAWSSYDGENPSTWPNVPSASAAASRVQAYATKAAFTDSSITEIIKDS